MTLFDIWGGLKLQLMFFPVLAVFLRHHIFDGYFRLRVSGWSREATAHELVAPPGLFPTEFLPFDVSQIIFFGDVMS